MRLRLLRRPPAAPAPGIGLLRPGELGHHRGPVLLHPGFALRLLVGGLALGVALPGLGERVPQARRYAASASLAACRSRAWPGHRSGGSQTLPVRQDAIHEGRARARLRLAGLARLIQGGLSLAHRVGPGRRRGGARLLLAVRGKARPGGQRRPGAAASRGGHVGHRVRGRIAEGSQGPVAG